MSEGVLRHCTDVSIERPGQRADHGCEINRQRNRSAGQTKIMKDRD